jgi:2-hydroxy fatty acid dioxygenase
MENPNYPINLGTVAALAYTFLYILMEPVAGLMLAPFILGGTSFAQRLLALYGNTINIWATAIHITGWIAQFIGHGKFEGRAPALVDNLFQATFLAPFFVWFEILFSCGYRPELKARLDRAIDAEIKRFRSTKQQNGLDKKEL